MWQGGHGKDHQVSVHWLNQVQRSWPLATVGVTQPSEEDASQR